MSCVWFRLIIVGTLLALLVDGSNGNDSNSCRNFTFSAIKPSYLSSQIINITSSCSMTTVCPCWKIASEQADIVILRNDTQVSGQSCTRNMSIQVLNFRLKNESRVQLLIDFINPSTERTRIINVQMSGDTEHCLRDEDCFNPGQVCSAVSRCYCPNSFVFVRNMGRCYPVISRLYGQCSYSEQCRPSNSICKASACQCPKHHFPDKYFFNCLPEARSFAEECATDENCQKRDFNSWCISGHCACKSNYFHMDGFCQSLASGRSGSSRIHCDWLGIAMIVTVMFSSA